MNSAEGDAELESNYLFTVHANARLCVFHYQQALIHTAPLFVGRFSHMPDVCHCGQWRESRRRELEQFAASRA